MSIKLQNNVTTFVSLGDSNFYKLDDEIRFQYFSQR